jgi:hypothetical protein
MEPRAGFELKVQKCAGMGFELKVWRRERELN